MHWSPLISLAVVFLLFVPSHEGATKAKSRCPSRVLKGGRVRIRSNGRVIRYVCLRGYQLLGNKYSTCLRGRWDSSAPVCIKGGCLSFNVPNGQVLETYRGAFATVHCDPGYSLVGNQGLYCNGAVWNDTLPICREIGGSVQKECDFESEDLCGWTHDANQDFNWKRHNFATPSGYVGTGPSFDHTLGRGLNGHYMYLESSSPRLENDTARLYSPVFKVPNNDTSCFKFWYHMFGHTTGSLNVFLQGKDSELLFSKYGDHGDMWQQAVLPLPLINSSFQILIEGVRGAGYAGDIAIDDVKLATGNDECSVVTAISEDSTRPSEDISCENRCFNTTADPSQCECTPDCITNNTCCPDYIQSCTAATEASEWLSSQSETEESTMDEISSTVTPLSETIVPKASIIINEASVSKAFEVITMKVQNATPSTPTVITTFLPSTKKLAASTSKVDLINKATDQKFITLKPKTDYYSVRNISTMTSSNTKHILRSFTYSTVNNPTISSVIYEKTQKIIIQDAASTNSTIAKPVTTTPITHSQSVKQIPLVSTKNPDIKRTFSLMPVINKGNHSFTNEGISTTQSYKQKRSTEQTTSNPVYNKTKGAIQKTVSSKTTEAFIRRTIFPTEPVPSTIHPYATKAVFTKPTKKPSISTTSMKTQQIIFNTPPPVVVFRTPKSNSKQLSTMTLYNSSVAITPKYNITPLYPKFLKNSTKKELKSRNDVLYHGWNKVNATIIPLSSSRSTTTRENRSSAMPTSTTLPTTSTSTQHSTVLSFDYENAVESKWRTKHKPIRTDSPNIAPLTISSSTEGEYIFVWVGVVLLILSTVLISACMVKRSRRNRRTDEDDELDIRFLASDEMLDFTLSRPDISEERTL